MTATLLSFPLLEARRVAPVLASLVLGACASVPGAGDLVAPVDIRTIEGAPPSSDGRAAFREAFCTMLREERLTVTDTDCDRRLWHLVDEPPTTGHPVPPLDAQGLELVLVTGAFSECVGEEARPFRAGAERFRAAGGRVRTLVVGGRSGTHHNAQQIADSLVAMPPDPARYLVLVGYSKGGLDILRFLVDFPDLAAQVDAVVGVSTPVFGTPLADLAAPAYAALAAKVGYKRCPPGDGDVLADLRPAAAIEWLNHNPLPAGVRYFSLAAFAARERLARVLVPTWRHLQGSVGRNDGQVVAADAVIPGSMLLGFVNADHWGAVTTLEDTYPTLLARPDSVPFPSEQLLVAMLATVADELDRAGTAGADPPRLLHGGH